MCESYQLNELLKLMDKYPLRVKCNGGYKKFNSKVLIITSNYPYSSLD